MRRRTLRLTAAADNDLYEVWTLVAERDGTARADQLKARLLSFLQSLQDFAELGSRHDDHVVGLRSSGVPGLRSAAVVFHVSGERVTVVAISYLGRDVWTRVSRMPIREMEQIREIKPVVAAAKPTKSEGDDD